MGAIEQFAKIAPALTALCAMVALLIALRQIRTVRQNEAKRQYSLFLVNSCDSKIDGAFVSGSIILSNVDLAHKYKLYLTTLMLACEEILFEFKGEKDFKVWRNALKNKLIPHRKNFDIVDQSSMDKPLVDLIDEIRRQYDQREAPEDLIGFVKARAK